MRLSERERNLLLKIARNPEPQNVFDKLKKGKYVDESNPYLKIVTEQINETMPEMHLPEPWNGHLSKARVMVISSNPSLNSSEDFPTKKWMDDEIVNFFDNRFADNRMLKSIYWTKIANCIKMCSIIPDSAKNLSTYEFLNKFVVCTEIVHCKSEGEEGVVCACIHEEEKFLEKIISLFSGELIIILGSKAKRLFYEYNLSDIIGNKKIVFLNHTSSNQSYKEKKEIMEKVLENTDDDNENDWSNDSDDDDEENDWSNDSNDNDDWSDDSDDEYRNW